jgi:hypothetical protein
MRPPAATPIPNFGRPIAPNAGSSNGYEPVAFDLPAANGFPAEVVWELFSGPERFALIATGQAATFDVTKAAAEAAGHLEMGCGGDSHLATCLVGRAGFLRRRSALLRCVAEGRRAALGCRPRPLKARLMARISMFRADSV